MSFYEMNAHFLRQRTKAMQGYRFKVNAFNKSLSSPIIKETLQEQQIHSKTKLNYMVLKTSCSERAIQTA